MDDGIIPRRFALERVTDPRELAPHLFAPIDSDLARRIAPGDIVLAGMNFACGKPRLQGVIALAALDLAVVCTSMPYKMLRRAVARGIPVSVGVPSPAAIAVSGDELEIDFETGAVWNITHDVRSSIPPLPPILADIVARGGARAVLLDWLAGHPEQAANLSMDSNKQLISVSAEP